MMTDVLLAIEWTVDPNIIEGPITIRWYGLLFASAFLLGHYLMKKMFERDGVDQTWLDKVFIYVMVATVVGARLGHVFFYDWGYYSNHPEEILMFWKGGLASHGAAVAIIFSLWLFSKRVTKKHMLWILDRVVVTIALAGVFIRLGNLMNHEIIGAPTDVPWAFVFTRVDELPRHPSQLYEAFAYLTIFGILMYAFWKTEARKKQGMLFGLFCASVFAARFFIEFIKENQSAFEEGMALNMGQWLSIPFVLMGLYFVFKAKEKKDAEAGV